MMSFWDAVTKRRSVYGFTGEKKLTERQIEEIVQNTLLHVPSPYNSQSTRLVLLFGSQHQRFWHLTLDALKQVTPADRFPKTEAKIRENFASGYGTVLFFIDDTVVDGLMKQFPLYADNFPLWAEQSGAMHQYVVWTALAAEGMGASLQHYNPLVDEAVRSEWNLPPEWRLRAEMPLGVPASEPEEKEFEDLETRLRIFGGE